VAATPEKKVKQTVTSQLKAMGAYYFYPVTSGFGSSGVPDIVGCYKGIFFGVECKAGKNKPTKLQEKNLTAIKSAGGIALVVNEETAPLVWATLIHLAEKRYD
jgi:Holliday junction resolvase